MGFFSSDPERGQSSSHPHTTAVPAGPTPIIVTTNSSTSGRHLITSRLPSSTYSMQVSDGQNGSDFEEGDDQDSREVGVGEGDAYRVQRSGSYGTGPWNEANHPRAFYPPSLAHGSDPSAWGGLTPRVADDIIPEDTGGTSSSSHNPPIQGGRGNGPLGLRPKLSLARSLSSSRRNSNITPTPTTYESQPHTLSPPTISSSPVPTPGDEAPIDPKVYAAHVKELKKAEDVRRRAEVKEEKERRKECEAEERDRIKSREKDRAFAEKSETGIASGVSATRGNENGDDLEKQGPVKPKSSQKSKNKTSTSATTAKAKKGQSIRFAAPRFPKLTPVALWESFKDKLHNPSHPSTTSQSMTGGGGASTTGAGSAYDHWKTKGGRKRGSARGTSAGATSAGYADEEEMGNLGPGGREGRAVPDPVAHIVVENDLNSVVLPTKSDRGSCATPAAGLTERSVATGIRGDGGETASSWVHRLGKSKKAGGGQAGTRTGYIGDGSSIRRANRASFIKRSWIYETLVERVYPAAKYFLDAAYPEPSKERSYQKEINFTMRRGALATSLFYVILWALTAGLLPKPYASIDKFGYMLVAGVSYIFFANSASRVLG